MIISNNYLSDKRLKNDYFEWLTMKQKYLKYNYLKTKCLRNDSFENNYIFNIHLKDDFFELLTEKSISEIIIQNMDMKMKQRNNSSEWCIILKNKCPEHDYFKWSSENWTCKKLIFWIIISNI